MDRKFMEEYLQALDEQRYPQAEGRLRGTPVHLINYEDEGSPEWGDCCLGVACELHPDVEFVWMPRSQRWILAEKHTGKHLRWDLLPHSIAMDLDLGRYATQQDMVEAKQRGEDMDSPIIINLHKRTKRQNVLAILNDARWTHPQIAQFIRDRGWDRGTP